METYLISCVIMYPFVVYIIINDLAFNSKPDFSELLGGFVFGSILSSIWPIVILSWALSKI